MASEDIVISVIDDPAFVEFALVERLPEFASEAHPTLEHCRVKSIIGATFEAYAVSDDGKVRVALKVQVLSTPEAIIQFIISGNACKPLRGHPARYYLSMTQGGVTKRLWTGVFTVKGEADA